MAKSKNGPSFLRSAGERETTTFWFFALGDLKPEFFIAELTRSLDSSTALSGRPTKEKECRPLERYTSTVTIAPESKFTWAEYIRAKLIEIKGEINFLLTHMFLAGVGGRVGLQPVCLYFLLA